MRCRRPLVLRPRITPGVLLSGGSGCPGPRQRNPPFPRARLMPHRGAPYIPRTLLSGPDSTTVFRGRCGRPPSKLLHRRTADTCRCRIRRPAASVVVRMRRSPTTPRPAAPPWTISSTRSSASSAGSPLRPTSSPARVEPRPSSTGHAPTGSPSGPNRRAPSTGWNRGRRVLEWTLPHAKWFIGGQLNVAANCLDRHLKGAAPQQGGDHLGGRARRPPRAHLLGPAPRGEPLRQRAEAPRRARRATASPSTCR